MSLFSFIGGIFKPAADLIDNVHTSDEERLALRNQLAQIEAEISIKMMELQSTVIDANAKVAAAEQEHGNALSKSWRPVVSISLTALLLAMGFGFIEFNQLLAQISGAFLGIYGIGRSVEKKR
jgi:hypothetical protein